MQAQPQQLEDRHQGSTITPGPGGGHWPGGPLLQPGLLAAFPHCVRICEEVVSKGRVAGKGSPVYKHHVSVQAGCCDVICSSKAGIWST